MKKILIILDGIVAKKLMQRIIEAITGDYSYDVIYMSDLILPVQKPSNFTFYKFDPTSKSKLAMVLDKDIHTEVLIALNSKDEMLNVIKNIREHTKNLQMTVLDYWGMKISDPLVRIYKGIEVLANGMVEKLPNVPVLAQNIGLRQGEIMEIRIPFGSSYAYRYIGSIEQKEWKIFGLYRNQKMITIKPSLVLKPNDVILVIGKPDVLMQVYNVIGKTQGQFPMPFGRNIYLYLDLYLQNDASVKKAIDEAKYLNQKLKNNLLIVRIIKEDSRKNNIGMIMLTPEMFKNKENIQSVLDLKIPIFKFGKENLKAVKRTVIILNDTNSYEQISPIVFDISSQLKIKTKIFDLDPVGDKEGKTNLLDHFENLAKIFNEKIEVVTSGQNPIRELKKQKDMLQLLPLKEKMFKKKFLFKFLYTNSDFIAFDLNKYNKLLIPIVEE